MGFFKWLNSKIHGRKETELRRIAEAEKAELVKCQQASLAGDEEATIKLRAYVQTLDEQSLKLIRANPPK